MVNGKPQTLQGTIPAMATLFVKLKLRIRSVNAFRVGVTENDAFKFFM
jgi:hypothetical protein